MDLATFKAQLEAEIRPNPTGPPVQVEKAWAILCAALNAPPDEASCEALSFSLSFASIHEGKVIHVDKTRFQIYFGWLIDAAAGSASAGWRTIEINFYYRYAMTGHLARILAALPAQDVETAYCRGEEKAAIDQKIALVTAYAAERREMWDAVRSMEPVTASYQFWVQ
jgi:hypothetical protein